MMQFENSISLREKRRHCIRIIYKSGAEISFWCETFRVNRNDLGAIVSIDWDNASPRPHHMGVSDISSVWQMNADEVDE